MPKKIYVGNLPAVATEQDVRAFVKKHARQVDPKANVSKLCHDTAVSVFVIEGGMPDTIIADIDGQRFREHRITATSDQKTLIKRKQDWTWV